jgi:hypothetical protein
LKLLNNFENPSSKTAQRPYIGDFDTENAFRKPPVTSYFLRIFPAANERSALKNINQSQGGKSEEGFSNHY